MKTCNIPRLLVAGIAVAAKLPYFVRWRLDLNNAEKK